MKRWKWYYGAMAAVFLICGIWGAAERLRAPDCGLSQVDSVEDLMELPVRISYAEGENRPLGIAKDPEQLAFYQQQGESLIQQTMGASVVVLARATGDLTVTSATLMQRVTVEQVLQGDAPQPGEPCQVWMDFGLKFTDDSFDPMAGPAITYPHFLNLMQPGETYLLFLEPDELNGLSGQPNYHVVEDARFGYLPVPFREERPMEDLSPEGRIQPYAQWSRLPTFVASQSIADARNAIAKEILSRFGFG